MTSRQDAATGGRSDADLDPAFGEKGKAVVPFPQGYDAADLWDMLVRPDGSIFVALGCGKFTQNLGMAKLTPDGQIDQAFGNNGFQIDPERNGISFINLKLLPDNRMLARYRTGYDGIRTVMRLTDRVMIDASFADLGVLPLEFNGYQLLDVDMIPLEDGGLVLVGAARRDGLVQGAMMVRLDKMGQLDPALGGDGFVHVAFDAQSSRDSISGVVQGDRYVLAGRSNGKAVIRRYLPDGTLDQTFGIHGQYVAPTGVAPAEFTDILIADGGGFVGIGYLRQPHPYGFLVGVDTNGRPDSHFANGEAVYLSEKGSSYLNQGTFDEQGRIVVSGLFGNRNDGGLVLAARYMASGALDTSFGDNGIIAVGEPMRRLFPRGLAIQGGQGVLLAAQVGGVESGPVLDEFGLVARIPQE